MGENIPGSNSQTVGDRSHNYHERTQNSRYLPCNLSHGIRKLSVTSVTAILKHSEHVGHLRDSHEVTIIIFTLDIFANSIAKIAT